MIAKPGVSVRRNKVTTKAVSDKEQISNGAFTKLTTSINASQATIKVAAASSFPPDPNFRIRVDDELMMVVGNTNTQNWSVIRGIEGTIATAHSSGTQVCQPLTAGSLSKLVRGDLFYAEDTGSVNALQISLSPEIESYFVGLTVHVKVAHANSGAATLNIDGFGAKSIRKNYNQNLIAGDLIVNQTICLLYDGLNFQLLSPTANSQNGISTTVTDVIKITTNGETDVVLSQNFLAGTAKVYLNGVRQVVQDAYMEQNSNTIVFIDPLVKGDSVMVDFEKE